MTNFDEVLKRIGEFGKAQLFFYVLVGICGIPTGIQNLSSVFVAGNQHFWCSSSNVSAPSSATCDLYDPSAPSPNDTGWSEELSGNASQVCNRLQFDTSQYTSTLQSQFLLVCDRSFLVSLTTTLYMCGVLTGATTFGLISDKIGRLKALLIALSLLLISSIMAAVVSNFVLHILLRFVTGSCVMGGFTIAFVIAMEIIGPTYRTFTGIMMQAWFTLGFLILTGTAFFVRNHITLQLVIAIPIILLLSYYWLLPESPRWLAVNDRADEALAIVQKIARMNGAPAPDDQVLKAMLKHAPTKTRSASAMDMLILPNMRKRSLNVFFNWFVNAFVFYGLSLGVGSLGGNVYVNALLSGLVEIPAYLLCILVLDRVGRVKPLTAFFFVGGVSCISCTALFGKPDLEWLLVTFAMIGKFSISATFAIIYVYTAEVFPTVIRNVAVGVSSTCARMGAIVAPQVVLTEAIWTPFPFLIYGIFPLIAGLLCLLLPETLNRELPETIEDGENFGKKPREESSAELKHV